MLDYDFGFVWIVLGLMYSNPYMTIWVYDGHIDNDMIVYRMTCKMC